MLGKCKCQTQCSDWASERLACLKSLIQLLLGGRQRLWLLPKLLQEGLVCSICAWNHQCISRLQLQDIACIDMYE
jgi:hypothetical protein